MENNKIKCFGFYDYGVLGFFADNSVGDDPNEIESLDFLSFSDTEKVTHLASGAKHNCVVLDDLSTLDIVEAKS